MFIICDSAKITDRGCCGAPDLVIEVVSPGSRKMDYGTKMTLYMNAGAREYWIIDPSMNRTTLYRFEDNEALMIMTAEKVNLGAQRYMAGYSAAYNAVPLSFAPVRRFVLPDSHRERAHNSKLFL